MTRPGLLGMALSAVALSACGPTAGDFGSECTDDQQCTTGACFKELPGGYCSQRCENQACPEGTNCAALAGASYCLQRCSIGFIDCRSGYYCADVASSSVCYPNCSADTDCGDGARCEESKCVTATAQVNGAACRLNVGCSSGLCEVAFNGGACTQTCAQAGPGSFGQDCAQGSVCAQVSEAGGLCLAACTGDAQCRTDYYCDVGGGSGVCRSKCRGAATCGLGRSCDVTGGGRCIEGSAPPRQTGATCAADTDCDSQYCLDQAATDFPKGTCSADCSADPNVCGAAGLCIVPSDPSAASVCLQKCTSNFDCRGDYFCSAVRNSTDRVCIPRCTSVPLCNAPEVCDDFSGDCVPPGQAGSTSLSKVQLGAMPLTSSATSKDFSVDIPGDAVSFTIVLRGSVGGTSVVSRLTSPSGELLFDLDNYLQSKVRILPVNDGDFGMLFPNSPRVAIQVGSYKFTVVNENGTGSGDVSVLIKRGPAGPLSQGKLDLNLWFAGLTGISAVNAATNPQIQAMLNELRRIYATVKITVGDVSYFDVPASAAATFAVIDTTDGKDSELRRLFEVSAGAPNNRMNFFLVREIKGGGAGFTILGVAGGIPGIPFEQGTNASGVAVTALDLGATGGAEAVARTMAHEGGHWLGLWHTSEQNGQMFDPLSDTLECPAAKDANMDKIVTSAECVGAGADNLMFWEAGPTASTVSSNQGFVLVRNPVVTQP
ncbi:MAG: hypothetical protein ACT4TC_19915 [Myxococcaceae bacterium]